MFCCCVDIKCNCLTVYLLNLKLDDCVVFSVDRDSPFTFELGEGEVIKGFEQGLVDMCVGEKRKLTIPPHLAYGDEGAGKSVLDVCFICWL